MLSGPFCLEERVIVRTGFFAGHTDRQIQASLAKDGYDREIESVCRHRRNMRLRKRQELRPIPPDFVSA